MKKIIIIITFLAFHGCFSNQALAKSWKHYVPNKEDIKIDMTGRQHAYGYVNEQRARQRDIFRGLLHQWKSNHRSDVESYIKMGFKKSLAELAVNKKISWAEKIVRSGFDETIKIPVVVQFSENRAKLMNHITGLGYERFNKVAKKYGYTNTLPLYKCLCSSAGIAGSSRGFSPARDKHCDNNDPCKGGNWGCSSGDFPKTWGACARLHLTNDGKNIFRAISENTNISREKDTGLKRLVHILKNRNQNFKNSCLPSLSDKKIDEILSSSDFLKSPAAAKTAMSISENSPNRCEEAVAMNLFLNSQKGMSNGIAAVKLLAIWILPSDYDKAGYLNDGAGTISKKFASGMVKNVLGKAFSAAGNIANAYDTAELMDKENNRRRTDIYYKEAYGLFQESKSWSNKRINFKISEIQKNMDETRKNIIKVREFYKRKNSFELVEAVKNSGGTMFAFNHNETGVKTNFYIQKEKRKEAAKEKKIMLMHKLESLMLKESVLSNYRKPFSQQVCDKYLADRDNSCKKKLAQQSMQKKIQNQRLKEQTRIQREKLRQEEKKKAKALERVPFHKKPVK